MIPADAQSAREPGPTDAERAPEAAPQPAAEAGPAGAATPGRGRRRHRRVVAPGTGAAGAATPDEDARRHAQVRRELGLDARPQAPADESARDRWFREQRPPHWG